MLRLGEHQVRPYMVVRRSHPCDRPLFLAAMYAIIPAVDAHVQRQLLDLNRRFYDRFARPFADSRQASQASLQQALASVRDGNRVLDIGCGDGRAARALEAMGRRVSYLGIDASPSLIALARERTGRLAAVKATFAVLDVSDPDWQTGLGAQCFDSVLAFALLHHIPGQDLRRRLVRQMTSLLCPAGRLIVSTWQFLASERLRRKVLPWAAIGLRGDDVEPGDYLLDWQRGGYGIRYCHLIGESELRDLCAAAGLSMCAMFAADSGLNLYAIASR